MNTEKTAATQQWQDQEALRRFQLISPLLKIKAKLLLFLYMNSALIFVLRLIALLSSALIRIRQ